MPMLFTSGKMITSGINVLILMIAILVVGHLQAFIDPAIYIVIRVSDSKWAS